MNSTRNRQIQNLVCVFLLTLMFVFVVVSGTNAQESLQKYAITFPISELGSCKDLAECKSYCDDIVNKISCINYAKKKGFYKADTVKAQKAQLAIKAKADLGCDSAESCKAFCGLAENRAKCLTFAQKNGIAKTPLSQNPEIIEKAKASLGCNSAEDCKDFCSITENREKCSVFAKEAGLKGGRESRGPAGCTSVETCKIVCSDPENFELCSNFSIAVGKKFTGLDGCDSKEACAKICETNPDSCNRFALSSQQSNLTGEEGKMPPKVNVQDMCNRTPNCSWTMNACKCNFAPESAKEHEDVCKANPESCKKFSTESREDFCKKSPEKCVPERRNNAKESTSNSSLDLPEGEGDVEDKKKPVLKAPNSVVPYRVLEEEGKDEENKKKPGSKSPAPAVQYKEIGGNGIKIPSKDVVNEKIKLEAEAKKKSELEKKKREAEEKKKRLEDEQKMRDQSSGGSGAIVLPSNGMVQINPPSVSYPPPGTTSLYPGNNAQPVVTGGIVRGEGAETGWLIGMLRKIFGK